MGLRHACVRTIPHDLALRNALRTGETPANLTRVTKRNSTIDDVAELAGVARVTVSRVLNNEQNVRAQTRERVLRAVEELGYSVNQQARALASGSGRQVMLIHAHNPEREPNSYYNAGLELGALRGCSALGLDLVTRAIDPDDENPSRMLASILDRERPRGIVVSPPLSDDPEFLGCAENAGVRIVAISAGEQTRSIVSSVGIDERSAGRAIAEHLLALGHSRIGFVQGPPEHRSATLRFDGFIDALRSGGLCERPWTATGDFTFKSGVDAAEQMLRDQVRVTALACANDDMAAGAMLALHRAGLEIPSAISVSGFDDTPMSEVVWPPLTTVRQPIKFIAERAVQMLFEAPAEGDEAIRYEVVSHELVVRESTAPPNPFRAA
jgi:LacI family transcriptional regulator